MFFGVVFGVVSRGAWRFGSRTTKLLDVPDWVSALVYQHWTLSFQLTAGHPSGLWSIRDRSTAGSAGVFILVGGSAPARSMVQQLRLRTV